jgi:hypothetical protein
MEHDVTGRRVPTLATWLLHYVLPPEDRDAMLGDLVEEYALRASASSAAATHWYWSQVYRSIPAVLSTRIRRDNWPLTVLIALGVYVLVGIFNRVGGLLVERLLGARVPTFAPSGVIVGLTAIALGGYVAAWIRRGVTPVLSALVVIVAVMLIASPRDHAPLWYQLTFLFVGPLAAHAGGSVRVFDRGIERPK